MENNSCLMLNCTTYLPISLLSIFDEGDLKDTGIEVEPHITLLYAPNQEISRFDILGDIETILGEKDFDDFIKILKDENTEPLFKYFELGTFSNESDYLVLKLRENNDIFKKLSLINKGLRAKYNVSTKFPNYTPHLTLAELEVGSAKKYLNNKSLNLILRDSYVSFEDLVISYGPSSTPVDRERYNLTTFNAVDYFFYVERNKKELENLRKLI